MELSEYDFKFKTFEISKKEINASKLFNALYLNDDYGFLYESLETSGKIGRYSILGGKPSLIFLFKKGEAEIIFNNRKISEKGNPFKILRALLKLFPNYPMVPPFSGGAIGYISYDAIIYIENIPHENNEDPELPEFYFIFPSEIIIIDNMEKRIDMIVYGEDIKELDKKGNILKQKINDITTNVSNYAEIVEKKIIPFFSNFKKEEFKKTVVKAKEYIKEGDIFQVVLSQRFETITNQNPFDIYQNLRIKNPSPYMYFIKFRSLYILGSSPEILIKLENGLAISRPIAGTRKRGNSFDEDKRLEKELLSDEKELAEHIMLVDLARNDLGRVCKYGTVKVDELITIERYSKVMHIVSNITGQLSDKYDSIELFKSSFPAGTVSGSPKIRAMEIIDELEPLKRGIYAGGIGYFGFNGDTDFCIAIRTIIVKEGRVFVQAGAGIVADSMPENEYNETLNKAEALKITLTEGK